MTGRRPSLRAGSRRAALGLCLPLLLAPVARPAATGLGPQDMAAMMQGMMAMMKLWNVFTGGSDFNLGGGFSPSSVFQGPPWSDPWTGAAAVSPWSNPWAGAPGGGMPWAGPMGGMPFGPGAGGRPAARPPGPLEGRWVGEAGEAVEFRGERFRLGAQSRGQVTGTFLIHGDRLVLYVPEGDTTRLYRFERRGEYLALQDDSGQVLIFRAAR